MIRFIGYSFLIKSKFKTSGIILIISELLGIIEEVKEI